MGRIKPFLTASWTHLILVNYVVPPDLLLPFVPEGSRLDTPDDAPDLHLLSLVVFHFSGTRVRGIPLPTAQWFPELNLRFYVRRDEKRATVFLREYVPSWLIILGARLLYNQPYYHATISHQIVRAAKHVTIFTRFRHGTYQGELNVVARNEPYTPSPGSQEHFLKEHYWGFDRDRRGRSFRYRVDHPVWRVFPVERASVAFDPGALLGPSWGGIDWRAAQHSVLFAEGSGVTLYEAEPLES